MLTQNKLGALNGTGGYASSRRGGLLASEVDQVRQRLGSRATPSQIAKITGRCEADVRLVLEGGHVQPLPAPVVVETVERPKKEQDRTKTRNLLLSDMWLEGRTLDDISKRLGWAHTTIRKRARLLGLPRRQAGRKEIVWKPEYDEMIRERYVRRREPASSVAERIPGATKSGVIGRARRLGLCRSKSEAAA